MVPNIFHNRVQVSPFGTIDTLRNLSYRVRHWYNRAISSGKYHRRRYHRCRDRGIVADGRGRGPRRRVSRCGRCCQATKMEKIKREDIPGAVVLALAGRPTSRPSCFGRNAPVAAAFAPRLSSPSAGCASSNAPRRST